MYKVTWTTIPKSGNLAGLRLDHNYSIPERDRAVRDVRKIFKYDDCVSAMVEDSRGDVVWCATRVPF